MKYAAVIALCSLAGLAIFGDQGLKKIYELRQIETRLGTQIQLIKNQNEELAGQIESLAKPEVLESLARQELGYLRPDEIIYYLSKGQ